MNRYACSACRMLTSTRIRGVFNYQQRQWFSRCAISRHTGVENLLQGHPEQQRERQTSSQDEIRPQSSVPKRGRYSGRALGPEELLQQLNDSSVHLSGSVRHKDSNGVHRQLLVECRHTRYTSAVLRLRSAVIRASNVAAEKSFDDEIRQALIEALADEQGRHMQSFTDLRNDGIFRTALGRHTIRVHSEWLETVASDLHSARNYGDADQRPQHNDPILLLQMCLLFDLLFRKKASRALWILAKSLSEFYGEQEGKIQTLTQYEEHCIHQLLCIWNLCIANELLPNQENGTLQQFVTEQIVQPGPLSWSFLPDPNALVEVMQGRKLDPQLDASLEGSLRLLCGVLGQSAAHPNGVETASSAILTFDLIQRLQRETLDSSFFVGYQPWIDLMSKVVDNVADRRIPYALKYRFDLAENESGQLHYKGIIDKFRLSSDSVSYHAGAQISPARKDQAAAGRKDPAKATPDRQDPTLSTEKQIARRFTNLSIKRLGRSLEQQDIKAAERVKQDIVVFNQKNNSVQLPLQVYEHLLLTLLSLRRFQPAIDVWKMMLYAGHTPTVKTYSIVIRHSRNARSTDAMDYFWNKMRNDGLQPDMHAWSARLFGLFHKGQTKQGLQALSQMGQEWITAARAANTDEMGESKWKSDHHIQTASVAQLEPKVHGVPKPNVYALNAAIGGVVAAKKPEVVPEILAWGRKFGIEPDVATYNYLIQTSMRAGKAKEAVSLLQRMKEKCVETNEDTWAILVNAMFEDASMRSLPPVEQEKKVLHFIKTLEGDGTSIGEKAYAIVLDRFLKQYNNVHAAQAVLAHMASAGIALNQYQCTIVMTQYFQQTPPDFAAIEDLWNHMTRQNNGRGMILGSQFYDRMIEGYASHHKQAGIAPMMSFLSEMESRGQKPSWRARTSIARALAERGDWDRLLQMVSSVRANLRSEKVGGTTSGQHDFWQFVISTGLLKDEGITDAYQITGENMGLQNYKSR